MELTPLKAQPDNNNVENGVTIEVSTENGTCSNQPTSGEPEEDGLLSTTEGATSNGDQNVCDKPDKKHRGLDIKTLKKELTEKVVGEVRLWMIILVVLILIILVILLISLFCSGSQEDSDDKYDASLFTVPLFFRGNFILSNLGFVQDPTLVPSSDDLFVNLKQKLTEIYTSSHALERYFSHATINTLRHRNATVQYDLKFMMPSEHEELTRYTLSREFVYSVFLQKLMDQKPDDPLYIQPSSLTMQTGNGTD
ncbi:TPA-induced transmembrane protein [Hoplias malabaricus]|uniref:TPA-induced transmembrane protein n=1 Tax=Hoplias malabaricus TaxID=27720 RepID=UPI00346366A1